MRQVQMNTNSPRDSHLLLVSILVGIPAIVLLEGVVQFLPPHYNAISQPESDLTVGPYGYLMAINFILRGVLTIAFVGAVVNIVPRVGRSRSGLILLGISAVGKVLLAFFPTDLTTPPHTTHGIVHSLVALVSFFCGALGVLLLARSLRHLQQVWPSRQFLSRWALATFIVGLIVILTIVVSSQIGFWGVLERLYDGLFYAWLFIVGLGLWRSTASGLGGSVQPA